jgi:hypothetical protein
VPRNVWLPVDGRVAYRLLSKEYEATIESSTADIRIAMSNLMLRRLTRPPTPYHENEELLAHIA